MDDEPLTLDDAGSVFSFEPCNKTAADYLRLLLEYEADGMIGDDTFRNGLNEILEYLSHRNAWD